MKLEAGRLAGTIITMLCVTLWSVTGVNAQTEFEPAKLEAFVNAAIEVNEVIERWQPRVDAAESEAEAEGLRERADAEIEAAINRTKGISAAEYRQIYHAAANDPQLMVEMLGSRTEE